MNFEHLVVSKSKEVLKNNYGGLPKDTSHCERAPNTLLLNYIPNNIINIYCSILI